MLRTGLVLLSFGLTACGDDADPVTPGGSGGLMNPMIEPAGCTIMVPTLTFHISTAACP